MMTMPRSLRRGRRRWRLVHAWPTVEFEGHFHVHPREATVYPWWRSGHRVIDAALLRSHAGILVAVFDRRGHLAFSTFPPEVDMNHWSGWVTEATIPPGSWCPRYDSFVGLVPADAPVPRGSISYPRPS